ncbi:MAG: hypothetical protein WBF77_06060 [Sulfurimonadaceae bacterium]
MRQNLGRMLGVILLLMASIVYANEPYTWSLKSSKNSAYVNEAIAVEYTCDFQDQANLHVIELNIAGENEEYRLLSYGVVDTVKDGKRRNTYRYVLFPKKAGQKEFRFKVLMRKTTKDSIEHSVIGRDNVEDYAFIDQELELPLLSLEVLGHQEKMTGNFYLDVQLDKSEVKAYEPVHLDVKIRGEGDFDQMRDIVLSVDGVNIFSEPGEKRYSLTNEGYKGEWGQKFSLVGKKDFVIEPIEFAYFDIEKKRKAILRSERFSIKVNEGYKTEELLDDVESDKGESWWSWSYLNYLLTLLTGMLLGRYSLHFKGVKKSPEGFIEEIEACSSVNMLLTKLVMNGDTRFSPLIQKYEALGAKGSLQALKREFRTLLKSD